MHDPSDWTIIQYDRVDSTQRVASALIAAGVPGRTAIVAAHQTAGIGRKGDPWLDLPGASLLCTAILRPVWPRSAPIVCYGMAASVAVIEAINDIAGGTATIKWPNDVMLDARKVAGILGDAIWTGRTLQALRIGVGLNVGGGPERFARFALPDATSIEAATGRAVTVAHILPAYLARLGAWDDLLTSGESRSLIEAWRAAVTTVGQSVRVLLAHGRELRGTATGVTDSGDLLLAIPGERVPLTLAASAVQALRPV